MLSFSLNISIDNNSYADIKSNDFAISLFDTSSEWS